MHKCGKTLWKNPYHYIKEFYLIINPQTTEKQGLCSLRC
jgi:hypothetical protein